MQALGMLLLAAATAGDGFGYGSPDVGGKRLFRSHLVASSNAPGPPQYNAANMAGVNAGNYNSITGSATDPGCIATTTARAMMLTARPMRMNFNIFQGGLLHDHDP